MQSYKYKAVNSNGMVVRGVQYASSISSLRDQLVGLNLSPISINKNYSISNLLGFFGKKHSHNSLSQIDKISLTKQLAVLVSASIPIEEALYSIQKNAKGAIAFNAKNLLQAVREGSSLSQAFSQDKNFDQFFCALVRSGEQVGQLGSVLNNLVRYLERAYRTRNKMLTMSIYPCMLFAVSLAIITGLMIFVVPQIAEQFVYMNQSLPWLTALIIAVSELIANFGLYFLIFSLLLVFLFNYLLKNNDHWKFIWHQCQLSLPLFGSWFRLSFACKFSHALGILIRGGMPINESLRLSKDIFSNLAIQQRIQGFQDSVESGQSLSSVMAQDNIFPSMLIQLVVTGEKTGSMHQMLFEGSKYLDDQFDAQSEKLLALMEPLVILVMGAFVGIVIFSMMLPIIQMNQLVTF
jgi:general secretion pathway protein F